MIAAFRSTAFRIIDAWFRRPAAERRRNAILAAMSERGSGMYADEIARAVGRPIGTLYADLAHLERVDRLIVSEVRSPLILFGKPPPARVAYFLTDPERPSE